MIVIAILGVFVAVLGAGMTLFALMISALVSLFGLFKFIAKTKEEILAKLAELTTDFLVISKDHEGKIKNLEDVVESLKNYVYRKKD